MKKVKTLLVSAIAALSLSACTLQDVVDWGKNAGGQVGQFFSSIAEKLGFKGKSSDKKDEKKEEACNHEDKNHDGICDLCGEGGMQVVHADDNHDHLCDVCGAKLSEHLDENNDFVCDICGKEFQIVDVELDLSDVQLAFALGEEFNSDGLKVIATSEFGNQKELEFSVTAPDMSEVGDKEVVVVFGEGNEDNLSYSINVSYWSEDDLEVLNNGTLLGYYGKLALPYLAGFNMRVETELDDQGKIESFKVVADDITAEGYLDLYNAYADIETKATISQKQVTFKLNEVAGQFEGFHDLSDVSVFSLVPSYVDDEGYDSRFFVNDEYYILGINGDGQLIIETRNVNAMLDGLFGTDVLDGLSLYYSTLNPYFAKILGWYFSELSSMAFIVPEVSSDALITPLNLQTYYPLTEYFDNYDLAWMISYARSTTAEYDQYLSDLVSAGYEKVVNQGQDGEYNSYVLDIELTGRIEIIPSYEEDLGTLSSGEQLSGIMFKFYYNAPSSYTNHLTLQAVALETMLETELEIDNDLYEDYGVVYASGYHPEENFTSGEAVAEKLARQLLEWGLEVTSEIEYDEDYEQYAFAMANDEAEFEFYVDKEAEESEFFFEVYISDLAKPVSISNAEKAAQAAFKGIYDKLALKGVDYVENADGTFSFVFSGGQGTAQQLKTIAEDGASVLGDSFALANSEADGESAWVATFNDVENNVQAKVTASIDGEGNVSVSFSFENHKFVTPETTMVAFLTELNGAAPSASDYLVDDQDGSCLAEFELEGTHEASELQGLAEGLIAKFGEGFENISSEAGAAEGTWDVVIDNASTGVEAQIHASIDADGKVTIAIGTDWIPQIVYNAEKVVADINANFASQGYSFSLKWNDNSQAYTLALNFGAGDESLQSLGGAAYTLASFLPDYLIEQVELFGDPTSESFVDLFGDGSGHYYMTFTSPDGQASVVIIAFVMNGNVYAQISVK